MRNSVKKKKLGTTFFFLVTGPAGNPRRFIIFFLLFFLAAYRPLSILSSPRYLFLMRRYLFGFFKKFYLSFFFVICVSPSERHVCAGHAPLSRVFFSFFFFYRVFFSILFLKLYRVFLPATCGCCCRNRCPAAIHNSRRRK